MRSHSGLGIASFITSVATGTLIFGLIVVAGILEVTTPGGVDEDDPVVMVVGCSIFVLLFCALVALGLGIGGLFQPERRRVFAILGTVLSCLIMGGTLLLILIGIAIG